MIRRRFGFSVAIAVVAWACSKDYDTANGAPTDAGAGIDHLGEDVLLAPGNPPGITIDRISVPRGEMVTASFAVSRGTHDLPLTVVASNVPAGVTVAEADVGAAPADHGSLQITAAPTAAEGTTSITLDLLEGTSKLGSATVVLEVTGLRAGSIDPSFGTDGFVDLNLPQGLLSFADDGAFYVMTSTGLARWTKDGARDTAYGTLLPAGSITLVSMVATSTGAVYFSGYQSVTGGAKAVLLRSTVDGTVFDDAFGSSGTATLPPADAKTSSAIALTVTPTAIFALEKVEHDATGNPGPYLLVRAPLSGSPADISAAALEISAKAPEIGYFVPAGAVDAYYLATADGADGGFLYDGHDGDYIAQDFPGTPTAVGENFLGSLLAPDQSALVHAKPSGFGVVNTGGPIHAIIVEDGGLPITAGCIGTSGAWSRYQPDGGLDPTFRAQSTTEFSCVLAARATPKYIYLAGLGGALNRLRLARLIR